MGDLRGPSPFFFDLWSHFYDARWVQRITYRPVHDAVVKALRVAGARRVLDVGCGTGIFDARVRHELPSAGVVGCDFSRGMLKQAAARGRGQTWVQGNALALPFRHASFDTVVCIESLHWFPDQGRALTEFFRVLEPGGRLLLALVNPPAELVSRAVRVGSQLLRQPLDWPTRWRLRDQVEAAGFRVEAQRRIYRLPAGLLLPPVLTVAVRAR